IRTGPAIAASSRRANDHSDQSGSSVTRSSSTFVSTRTTSALAAGHRHDFGSAEPSAGMTPQARKAALSRLLRAFHQDDLAVFGPLEVDHAAWTNSQYLADPFGNGDLPLAGDGRDHGTPLVRRSFCCSLLSMHCSDYRVAGSALASSTSTR